MKKVTKKSISLLFSGAVLCLALIICASVLLPKYQITIDMQLLGDGIDVSKYDPSDASVMAQAAVTLRTQ